MQLLVLVGIVVKRLFSGTMIPEAAQRFFEGPCRTEPSGLRPFASLRLELRSLGERITCAATTERAMVPFREYLSAFPLVAILRGLRPDDAAAIGEALVEGGFRIIEVPLNSPEPLRSIEIMAKRFGPEVLVGAGTVLDPADVDRVRDAGGRLVVMPHGDAAVIARAVELGLACTPGVATPTEAFAALKCGAAALKMFPAENLPPVVVKAWRAVVPKDTLLLPVGGINPDNMAPYVEAGADGFGLGSALFSPGATPATVRDNARRFAVAWELIRARQAA